MHKLKRNAYLWPKILFSAVFMTCTFLTSSFSLGALTSPEMDMADPDQQQVLRLIPIMEERLRRTLPFPVVIWNGRRLLSAELEVSRLAVESSASGWAAPGYIGPDNKWWVDLSGAPTSHCIIYITGGGLTSVGAARTSLLAHEIFHCFQFAQIGWSAVQQNPSWVIEGSANFAGEYFSGGSTLSRWTWPAYFDGSLPIDLMRYSAIGVYATLESLRISDVFEKIQTLLASDPLTQLNRLSEILSLHEKAAIAPASMMLVDWGESYRIQFPEIPAGLHSPTEHIGEVFLPSSYTYTQGALIQRRYFLPANKIIQIKPSSDLYGRVRIMRGDGIAVYDDVVRPDQGIKVCRGQCGCPNGTDPYDVIRIDDAPSMHASFIQMYSGEGHLSFKEVPPGCCDGSTAIDPRLVGYWEIETDPLRDLLVPPTTRPVEKIASGYHAVSISPNGSTQRIGNLFFEYKWIGDHNKPTRIVHRANSTVQACLESRPTGPNKGWIKHLTLNESSDYYITSQHADQPSNLQHVSGEAPWLRWGMGTSGKNSIYEFPSPGRLQIRGTHRTYRKVR